MGPKAAVSPTSEDSTMTPWLWIKVTHVLLGAFWFGGVIVTSQYLAPAARTLGPAASPVLKYVIGVRKLTLTLNAVAGLTVLTGLGLYDRLSNHFRQPLVGGFNGWALTLGALFGILALLWGSAVPSRAAKRLGDLTAKLTGPPTPEQAVEIAALQKRLHVGGTIAMIMVLLALVGMSLSHPI
jgi:hypothetical protein